MWIKSRTSPSSCHPMLINLDRIEGLRPESNGSDTSWISALGRAPGFQDGRLTIYRITGPNELREVWISKVIDEITTSLGSGKPFVDVTSMFPK